MHPHFGRVLKMNLGIQEKHALVTGAGRGLGQGICLELAANGAKVLAVSRTFSDLKILLDKMGGKSLGHGILVADLSEVAGQNKLKKYIRESFKTPDIIVNNLGGNLDFTNPLGTVSEWRKVMNFNVEVAIELNRTYIPQMRRSKWGRICHVSSISALENQGPPAYCAAKAALNAYVRSLGRYVCSDNVILTSIMPGAVFTPGGYWDKTKKKRPDHVKKYLRERMAIRRFGKIEEISGVVAFLCSEQASFCVGSCFLADGGQGRVFFPHEF
jgi:3-oxoacyl-[acyl-carrier protein] reductase